VPKFLLPFRVALLLSGSQTLGGHPQT